MSLPWFRMYAEAVDDAKLRLLAFEDRWHFVAILCCKCQGVLDIEQPLLDRRVAVKLGLQKNDLDEVRRRLMEAGLINDMWQPLQWMKRQFVSDVSTNRVRKYRENKTKKTGNGDETFLKRTRYRTDTDTEQNIGAKRATQAPKEFPIAEDLKTWAKEQGLKASTLEKETEKFLDYHRAKGSTFKDWNAAWRKWMRNVKEWAKDKPVENMFEGAL